MVYLKQRIFELLVQNKLLTDKQVRDVFALTQKQGGRLSRFLLEKGLVEKKALVDCIDNNITLPLVNVSQYNITSEILKIIPPEISQQYSIAPLLSRDNRLTVGVADPLSLIDLEDIKELKGYVVNAVYISKYELSDVLSRFKEEEVVVKKEEEPKESTSIKDMLEKAPDSPNFTLEDTQITELAKITQGAPIVKTTNLILETAIEAKASDILIEPQEHNSRIRFRVDGVFYKVEELPRTFHPFIISRIKVLSEMDISEHRLPQDGQFKIKLKDKEVDFRVSVFPTINGEKIAIRILDKSLGLLDVNTLGMRPQALERLKHEANSPHGMCLVCGPTGSGKTSTLYSLLKYVHTSEKNIITVEDPVEYQIKGINQVAVNLRTGLTFSRCLRSILRQDPDIIMIGEIRDLETVDIAIKAALTGHLVLSTLHTTTASGSVVRLIDMGVEPFLINASLICIIAQRLARRICGHCKESVSGEPYFRGRGCPQCLKTGYKGRVLIPEILYMSPKIRESIASGSIEENKIKAISREEGMMTLREEGLKLAVDGVTTYEEVIRVTPAD